MLSHNEWNRPETNKNFISPTRVVGDVLYNCQIDKTLVTNALYNQNPYYPLPIGMSMPDIEIVRKGDIIFTLIDNSQGNYQLSTTYNNTGDNTTVPAIAALNGQGIYGEPDIMSKILPLGLAFEENERNKETRFNGHVGGIHTVLNTGNENINAGDWVMAYAPTMEEVESQSGGRGKIADKNKLITLWFKPYRPNIHKLSAPKQILTCLTGSKPDNHYLPSYVTACKSLIDASLDIGILFLNDVLKDLSQDDLDALTGNDKNDKEAVLIKLMRQYGHTEYYEKNSKPEKVLSNKKRQSFINQLFIPYSDKINNQFKDPSLHRNQADAISLFINSTAHFYHDVAKNVLWRAVTSARPKENFNVHCSAYMS